MSKSEKIYEHSVAHKNPGEAFIFSPVLNQEIIKYLDETMVDVKPFDYKGLGIGEAMLFRLEGKNSFNMPAGDIRPIRFKIVVEDLTEEQISQTAAIIYKGIVYQGQQTFDKLELKNEGVTNLMFTPFIAEDSTDDLAFPQSADFNRVNYVLNNEPIKLETTKLVTP